MSLDPRFLAANAREVFTGNELLVKGCLEAQGGVSLLTGYPGSPIAGFFDTLGEIQDLLKSNGVRAFQANNEALAAASVNGSQMLPCRAVVAFKSVGFHVAADALALANLAGAHPQGGAMVILGDDPWCESTQVPADSRFLCEHLRMPVVEPAGPQQLKDWVDLSFKLSQAAGLYIGYIVTPAQADGGGSVWCYPNQAPQLNTNERAALETASIDLGKVLLPPRTWQRELGVPERFARTMKAAREVGINQILPAVGARHASPFSRIADDSHVPERAGHAPPLQSSLGFIVTGMAGAYLQHLLAELGLAGMFPILQMGMSYPADVGLVREFARLCQTMVVIEERRSFLEKNIREALAQELPHAEGAELSARLFGKAFPWKGSGFRVQGSGNTALSLNPESRTLNPDGIPSTRGLNYSVLAQKLIPLLQQRDELPASSRQRLDEEMKRLSALSRPKLEVISDNLIPRTPTFCPGCPHRDSSAVLLELRQNLADPQYMKRRQKRGPVDLVAHGDTGCYTMLMFPPTEQLMHNYSGMGLGGGTGSGIDPFITNKQIVFMGDGTFFHSGQIAISNSIKAAQDITYIILENGTTAMTGHQEHAGTAEDLLGNRHYVQSIESIVRGMAGSAPIKVVKLAPEKRGKYKKVLEETILADGVKVILADKECGIVHRRKELQHERQIIKKKGYLPNKTQMNITPEVCEGCLECARQTTCPGLVAVDTDYGRKLDTDVTWCVNDGACERVTVSNAAGRNIKPCPSFEEITIVHKKRRRYKLPKMELDKLPEPQRIVHDMNASGNIWRVHMAGVGGMGIGLVAAILVRAGHSQGYRVVYSDRKGLAIRNGGVFSQITFVQEGVGCASAHHEDGVLKHTLPSAPHLTASIPYGRADLLFGVDILESARAIDPREQYRVASPERTYAVLNLHKQSTVNVLLGKQDFDPDVLCKGILDQCRSEQSYVKNLSEICQRRLGSTQFVNIMMLGVAYQLGLIPVSAHSIAWAIRNSLPRDHRKNLKAFNIGRKLALEPRMLPKKPAPETWQQLLTNKIRILRKTRLFGRMWSTRYEQLVQAAMKQVPELPEELKYDLAVRLYDLLQYDDHRLARRYLEMVKDIYRRDSADRRFAATAAVIWNLAKVMLIKDEPYVAYLLTRHEKIQRDIEKYGVDEANGDRLVYRHHTNPELSFGPWRIRFRITSRNWMLQAVRRCKWWRYIPGWHKREAAFRDWYVGLLERVDLATPEAYQQALRLLRCPETVAGYREIRYPKMDAARAEAERALCSIAPPVHPRAARHLENAGV